MSTTQASAPALNINELNFDTCERLRHLDWLLTQLGIRDGTRVLDVGGFPCYMARAFPRRTVVTADMYTHGHAPYVKASGAALPFPDNTFDVTIACDVLEHVPAQFRESFLTELSRVSSRAVVVAGPYTTPGAERAEATVRMLLPESSPAQMWLAEHAECGLPSMADSVETFKGAGAAGVGVLPVGSLTEWMLFFAGQAAGERDHQAAEAMRNFIKQYNQLHTAPGVSYGDPAYRHAIVAAMDDSTVANLNKLSNGVDTAAQRFDREQVEAYVDSLGAVLRSVFKCQADTYSNETNQMDSISREYIQRLEKMVSHRGLELPPRDRAKSTSASFPQRLRDALRTLRG